MGVKGKGDSGELDRIDEAIEEDVSSLETFC